MRNSKVRALIRNIHPHVLPHPTNNWQAFLLKNPSLVIYLLFLVALTLIFNIISVVKPGILGFASNIQQQDVITLTNQQRADSNLATLTENPLLTQAAVEKANNMFSENYWAHIAPSGKSPWDFIKSSGYNYTAAGENLARDFDQSESMVNAWMASSSHRENLLNPSYSEIGVGVVNGVLNGRETTLVVQLFAAPLAKATQAKVTVPKPQTVMAQTPPPSKIAQVSPAPTKTSTPTQPTPQPGPATQVSPTLIPVSAAIASVQTPVKRPLINSFQLIRNTSFALLVFLVILLAADLAFARRHRLVRATGHTMAHLGLLLVLLVAIWYTNSGLIL